MAIKRYNKEVNGKKYAFGIMALSQFCLATGCSDHIQSVASAFQGSTKIRAILEMVKGGYAQAYEVQITDAKAAELVEAMTPEQHEELTECFLSSIVGEPFSEWAAKVRAEIEKANADADETGEPAAADTETAPNVSAPKSNGAKTKNAPSES